MVSPGAAGVMPERKTSTHEAVEGGYNLLQQLTIFAIIFILTVMSFLPCILKLEIHDDEPEEPYSGEANSPLIDIVNTALVACTSMMFLDALLGAKTLYLPIKIAFPRFVMVLGVLFTSSALYMQRGDSLDRLNFLISSHYAKIYVTCGGLCQRCHRKGSQAVAILRLRSSIILN
jgi:hypothetical protein